MSATSATVEPLSTGKPIPRSRPLLGWHLHDGIVVGKRNLIQTIRVPELLFFSLVQPVIFVLMFAYVFGGAIPVPGASGEAGAEAYRAYLIPGIFAQTVAFAAASSTVGIAEDMHKGLIDRFRSLPMKASAVLFGRTFADAARMILVLTVLTITGLVVGWRINDGFINAVFAYALLLLFAYVVAWIGSWIVPVDVRLKRVRSAGRNACRAAGGSSVESVVGTHAVMSGAVRKSDWPGDRRTDLLVVAEP